MTDQVEQELRKQVESGREAKIAQKFFEDFLIEQRAYVIARMENDGIDTYEGLLGKQIYLHVLKEFERREQTFINYGEIAEKELNDNGE